MSNKGLPFRTSVHDEEQRVYDPLTHAITTLTSNHRLAHDGMVYHTSGKVDGLANAGTATFYMRPGAGIFPHWSRMLLTFGDGDVDVNTYENVIVSADGTPITAHNTNRNSDNVPGLLMYGAPTITDIGDVMHTLWAPDTGAKGSRQIGISNIQNGEEWIMKPETGYAVQITNNSGGTISYSYEALWYEVDYQE